MIKKEHLAFIIYIDNNYCLNTTDIILLGFAGSGFTLETCRSMVAMMDVSFSGNVLVYV